MASPLGQPTDFAGTYTPSWLYPLDRSDSRTELVAESLPFHGEDVWTGYELTWLDTRGKPEVAGVRINVPCTSPCMVESKSMKLYLNSFAQTRFGSRSEVLRTLSSDLAIAFRSPVIVELLDLVQLAAESRLPGVCIDQLDVDIDAHGYQPAPERLRLEEGDSRAVHETLFSHLFRSLCPITGQPDFATIIVSYTGRPIVRTTLLEYLVSYRCHEAYHEATVEQIFVDLRAQCECEHLSVYGRFLRRGGVDINPFRSTEDETAPLLRLSRQ